MRCFRCAWLSLVLLFGLDGAFPAAEPDPELLQDEQLLRDAGVGTDGPALLTFFRQRTLADLERANLKAMVRLLGDDSFAVREKASADLLAAGHVAESNLREAIEDDDPEIVRRAEQCLTAIQHGANAALSEAAARLLAVRRPPGTVDVLLAYLPVANDEVARGAIRSGLLAAGLHGGQADPSIVAALNDKEPARRAAAAAVLAQAAPGQREAVRGLLADRDPRVRFETAAALVRAGDREAVPILIALFSDIPLDAAWQVEDLLFKIGGEHSPQAVLDTGSEANRAACRAAWESWWKARGITADLGALAREEPVLGLTLISEYDGSGKGGAGRIWECGPDGKARWEIDDVRGPIDVQALPGGRLLVAEHQGQRVTERDREGKVLWEKGVATHAISCQRLASGNTFIATYNELLEVNRQGKVLFSLSLPDRICAAQRLSNRHIIYIHNDGYIAELNGASQEIRRTRVGDSLGWAGVEGLGNGHFLVAKYNAGQVVELDGSGKVIWQCNSPTPAWATRLRNGNTLVCNTEGHSIIEYDRAGQKIATLATQGRSFPRTPPVVVLPAKHGPRDLTRPP